MPSSIGRSRGFGGLFAGANARDLRKPRIFSTIFTPEQGKPGPCPPHIDRGKGRHDVTRCLKEGEAKESAIEKDTGIAHLADVEIMSLLEGSLGEGDRARAKAHLRCCARCSESYRDSAVVRGLWVDDEAAFSPTGELAATARAALRLQPEGTVRETDIRQAPHSRRRPYRRWVFATAAAVAAIVVGLVWLPRHGDGPGMGPPIDAGVLSPVRTAIEAVSARGEFVLPGGERALGALSPVYRSGFVPLSDSLSLSMERLRQSFQEGDSSPDLARWLIGAYIATGQMAAARDLAGHPLVSESSDWRVVVMKALVAHMEGDRGEAEALLRGVLESDPDNPVALIDLAVVLSEEGREDEARNILTRVSEAHAGTPLATRAMTILSRLQSE
jgi:hypothetical protein